MTRPRSVASADVAQLGRAFAGLLGLALAVAVAVGLGSLMGTHGAGASIGGRDGSTGAIGGSFPSSPTEGSATNVDAPIRSGGPSAGGTDIGGGRGTGTGGNDASSSGGNGTRPRGGDELGSDGGGGGVKAPDPVKVPTTTEPTEDDEVSTLLADLTSGRTPSTDDVADAVPTGGSLLGD